MGLIEPGRNPWNDVILRRSSRARRLSLRVSRIDGRVTLTLPPRVSEREARRFVESKAEWIVRAQAEAVSPVQVAIGARLPIEGKQRLIVAGEAKAPELGDETLAVGPGNVGKIIRVWMMERARARANLLGDRLGDVLGRRPSKLTLRDPRSRWGSCTSDGGIMISWRLLLAPTDVFDYVVAHEVAHLREMNHSAAFWDTVRDLMPEYEAPRLWLRQEGPALHRYRFD